MANTTETVFVEFVVDDQQLEGTTDTLERVGKIDKATADQFKKTNAELQKRTAGLNSVAKAATDAAKKTGASIKEVEQIVNHMLEEFAVGFQEGMIEALKDAGLEFDQFGKIVNKNNIEINKSSNTVKARLAEVTRQLQAMKVAGQDDTEQYKQLTAEAGNLRDALGDVSQEINNAAANSQALEGMVGIAQGVTAGFAVAQGAVGLFGVKSEELEETLVNVNSALALLQGTQQLVALAQGESATATFLQTSAQKLYNVVVGESIGLMAAFRIALAATGIGLLIIGIIALVQALDRANQETEEANRLLDRNKNIIEADTAAIKRNTDEQIARAQAINSKESEIIKLRGHGLVLQREAIEAANQDLIKQLNTLDQTSEAYFLLNKQLADNKEVIKDINNDLFIEQLNLDKQRKAEQLQAVADGLEAQLAGAVKNSKNELNLAKQTAQAKAAIELNEAGDNLQKRLLIEANLQKQIRALDLQYAQVRQQDRIDQAERSLLSLQQQNRQTNDRIRQDEIDIQKQLIRERARLELLQEGLTANARKLIIEKSLADQLQLQKEFNRQTAQESLQDLISRNNAQLSNVQLVGKERLAIEEENLIIQAQMEIEANFGLVDKIKEIRAKLNEDLRALRLASLEKELNYELSLEEARTGALRRASERTAANENKGLQARIAAINQLAVLDIAALNKKDDANKESLRLQLISQKEYNLRYAQLKDEELKITEETEIKKRELEKATRKERALLALDTAVAIAGIIQQFGQQQTEAEQQRIDAQRQEIEDLREAGAITEKEALARQKKLDNEEKSLKRKQAERDKAIALFQAIINTASATIKAFAQGGPILAAIAAALGAAQIALIASKPIPKFAKGKKGNYEGWGEIGEAGAELMERNGDMYLAKKSSVVWVGKKDKVFTPRETATMLERSNMQPYIIKDARSNEYKSVYGSNIDYQKLGKVISENLPQVGLNVDEEGFTQYMKYKNAMKTYLDTRRSYK